MASLDVVTATWVRAGGRRAKRRSGDLSVRTSEGLSRRSAACPGFRVETTYSHGRFHPAGRSSGDPVVSSSKQPLFLGRQPIFDRRLEVEAYELLYRSGPHSEADFTDEDRASSEVLVNACIELGLERVVGDREAYVNLTRNFLTGQISLPVGPEQVVLEVLEHVEPDEGTRRGIERLKTEGFRIALDDFEPGCMTEAFLPLADIVKLDCRQLGVDRMGEVAHDLARYGVRLLAEKVESHDELEACRNLGFDLFQGYFLAKPSVIEGRKLSGSRTQLLRILAQLHAEDADLDTVQETIVADVSLSYRLMRYINSAAFGLSRELHSVREAVMYLGLVRVRNLVTLFLLTNLDEKPEELVRTAMLRGRMCELLARETRRESPDSYFTVGMFSCLDALLDCAMGELLEHLPLSEAVNGALLERAGDFGAILDCVVHHERGDFGASIPPGVGAMQIRSAFVEACAWVDRLTDEAEAA